VRPPVASFEAPTVVFHCPSGPGLALVAAHFLFVVPILFVVFVDGHVPFLLVPVVPAVAAALAAVVLVVVLVITVVALDDSLTLSAAALFPLPDLSLWLHGD